MNIGFDLHPFFTDSYKNRGVGNYSDNLINALRNTDDSNYFAFNCYAPRTPMHLEAITSSYSIYADEVSDYYLHDDCFVKIMAAQMQHFCCTNDIDIMHFLTPFNYETAALLKYPQKCAKVLTVYDFIHMVFPEHYLTDIRFKEHYLRQNRLLSSFDAFIAISDSTASDMLRLFDIPKEKVYTVHCGIGNRFRVLEDRNFSDLKESLGIEDKFIMYVGGGHYTKNAINTVRAYAELDSGLIAEYQLVMLGLPSGMERNLNSMVKSGRSGKRVIIPSYIDDDDMVRLYNAAGLFVMPSKYEGFGLPVVEAFACGTPVVTSNNSSLGEISKDRAVQVDPFSVDSISQGIAYALTHKTEMTQMSEKALLKAQEFTWRNTAKEIAGIYKEVFGRKQDELRKISISLKRKKRIAWFSPMPPLPSGISDYSCELLEEISKEADVDIYIDSGYIPDIPTLKACNVYIHTEYEKNSKTIKYDETIYQMGGSIFHIYILEYMKKHPGIVVNHDVNSHGLLLHMTLKQGGHTEYMGCLCEEFGKKAAVDIFMQVTNNNEACLKHYVNSYYLGGTRKVIVLTQRNKRLMLEKEIGRDISVIPLHGSQVDKNLSKDKGAIRRKLNIPEDTLVVASFGALNSTKKNIESIYAFIQVSENISNICYYFVGNDPEDYAAAIKQLEKKHPHIRGRIKITSYVSHEEFMDFMTITDVCINLRGKDFSVSGTLPKALMNGLPTIITNAEVFENIPEDCVIRIETGDNEVADIAEKLQFLLSNDAARMELGNRAKQFAERELSVEAAAKRYLETIEDAILQKDRLLISNSDIESLIDYFGKGLMGDTQRLNRFSSEIASINMKDGRCLV